MSSPTLCISAALVLLASTSYAQGAPVAPPRTLPAAITRPLVITVRNGRGDIVTGYNVCVGTRLNHQEYGIMFTNDRGEARFPNAPMLGPVLVSVAPTRDDHPPVRMAAELEVNAGNRTLEVKLVANWQARCPGIAERENPADDGRTYVVGTLKPVGNSLITGRKVRFYTINSSTGEPYVELAGQPNQYRSFEEPLGWTAWRPLTVTDGNHARYVTHDIRDGNGTKEVRLQFSRNGSRISPEYTVRFDFMELYSCELTYRRADNAMAPVGEPQGNIGEETATVMIGTTKTFDTGWPSANEKRRGYGMHLRTARNTGFHPIEFTIRGGIETRLVRLEPGQNYRVQADLVSVHCP